MYRYCQLLLDQISQLTPNINKTYKNTGSLGIAIIYCIYILNINNIYIFGLDFYEKDYLVPQDYDYETERKQTQSIKNDFSLLFKFFNKVEFVLHTVSSYNPDLENVTIL